MSNSYTLASFAEFYHGIKLGVGTLGYDVLLRKGKQPIGIDKINPPKIRNNRIVSGFKIHHVVPSDSEKYSFYTIRYDDEFNVVRLPLEAECDFLNYDGDQDATVNDGYYFISIIPNKTVLSVEWEDNIFAVYYNRGKLCATPMDVFADISEDWDPGR